MKKIIWVLCIGLILIGCQNKQEPNHQTAQSYQENKESHQMELTLTVSNHEFLVKLEDNEATQMLLEKLPMTFTMEDLHGNEKYVYTDIHFPAQTQSIGQIEAGDFMLFGDNCLVVFYKSFATTYQYTRLGKIENVAEFVKVISQNNQVNVTVHR